MKSETAHGPQAERTAPAEPAPVDAAKLGAEALPAISETFDPFLFTDAPLSDPGDRHAAWTLVATLRRRLRDLMAVAEAAPDAMIVGAELGWLAPQLLVWGTARVTVADRDPAQLARVAAIGEALAVDRSRLLLADDPSAARDLDLVIADERGSGSGVAAAELLNLAPECLVLSDRKEQTRAELRHAGAAVGIATPPLDADRRFVSTELVLLVARASQSGGGGGEGGLGA